MTNGGERGGGGITERCYLEGRSERNEAWDKAEIETSCP